MNTLQPVPRLVMRAAIALWVCLSGLVLAQTPPAAPAQPPASAIFATGCFWCAEADFSKVDGIISITSGYTGGQFPNPTYEQVYSQSTGHAEAVLIIYDPAKVTYQSLLDHFWHSIDPTTQMRQFCDSGSPHRTAIYATTPEQLKIAKASRDALEQSKFFATPIVTEVAMAGEFYAAETYHQHYFKKNPLRYRFYRFNCGRDSKLKELWGDLAGH